MNRALRLSWAVIGTLACGASDPSKPKTLVHVNVPEPTAETHAPAVRIAVPSGTACAVRFGTVYCWGGNTFGGLVPGS